jgi:hypothetical protein
VPPNGGPPRGVPIGVLQWRFRMCFPQVLFPVGSPRFHLDGTLVESPNTVPQCFYVFLVTHVFPSFGFPNGFL